jgi:predicted dehydrogenase
LSLDFLEKNAQIVRLFAQDAQNLPPQEQLMEFDTNAGKKWLQLSMPETEPVNAIQRELETFHEAIVQNQEPVVTLRDGFDALHLAHRILKEIEARQSKIL